MNSLEKLVPPLELCKQIPAGEFENSALVWEYIGKPWDAKETWILKMRCKRPNARFAPAPTVEETLISIKNESYNVAMDLYGDIAQRIDSKFNVRVFFPGRSREWSSHHQRFSSASEAAMRLWFKVKGIEVKNEQKRT